MSFSLEKNNLLSESSNTNIFATILFILGNILSLIFFIIPLIQITKLYKGGIKAKDAPLLLLFAINFNCILWLLVAFSSNNITEWLPLIISYIGGLSINLALVFFFLYIVLKKDIGKFLGFGLFSLNLIIEFSYLILRYVINEEKEFNEATFHTIGYVATLVNILMYFSPATDIKNVFRTGNYDKLTLIELYVGLGGTFIMFIQAIIKYNTIDDIVIKRNSIEMFVANLIAFILLIVIVCVYVYSGFKHTKPKQISENQIQNDLGEGLQNSE